MDNIGLTVLKQSWHHYLFTKFWPQRPQIIKLMSADNRDLSVITFLCNMQVSVEILKHQIEIYAMELFSPKHLNYTPYTYMMYN